MLVCTSWLSRARPVGTGRVGQGGWLPGPAVPLWRWWFRVYAGACCVVVGLLAVRSRGARSKCA